MSAGKATCRKWNLQYVANNSARSGERLWRGRRRNDQSWSRDGPMPLTRPLLRALAAETVGTFALVFAGAGAIMVDAKSHALGHVGVAISFGLVIMVMIYAVGHISGAHFNPAVSFAFALTRHFPWPRVAGYWLAQTVGAVGAAAILRGSLGNLADVGVTLPAGSQSQSFLWEVVLTFFLMFVIMAVATDTRAVGEAAAIAIGGTVGLDAMFGGPISGASMNPARSLGPALVSGDLHALWLYIVAPLLGAALGALSYQFVRGEQTRTAEAQEIEAKEEAA
jgi:aquaporin NIP